MAPEQPKELSTAEALNLACQSNSLSKGMTLGELLIKELFGDNDIRDIYDTVREILVTNGIIDGEIGDYGLVKEYDEKAASEYIRSLVERVFEKAAEDGK